MAINQDLKKTIQDKLDVKDEHINYFLDNLTQGIKYEENKGELDNGKIEDLIKRYIKNNPYELKEIVYRQNVRMKVIPDIWEFT